MSLTEEEMRRLQAIASRTIDQVFGVLVASSARPTASKPEKVVVAPPPIETGPRLSFTLNETSEMLGLSRSTLYKLIKDGKLTSTRVGSRRLVRISDLKALLEDA